MGVRLRPHVECCVCSRVCVDAMCEGVSTCVSMCEHVRLCLSVCVTVDMSV